MHRHRAACPVDASEGLQGAAIVRQVKLLQVDVTGNAPLIRPGCHVASQNQWGSVHRHVHAKLGTAGLLPGKLGSQTDLVHIHPGIDQLITIGKLDIDQFHGFGTQPPGKRATGLRHRVHNRVRSGVDLDGADAPATVIQQAHIHL